MNINRKRFFDAYREEFGKIGQSQVNALDGLLAFMEADSHITDPRHAAYMLATTKHETANTFLPIHEYGSRQYFINRYGSQTKVGKSLGNDTPEEGALYAGVGDVQLTGESNYERAEAALRREYPAVVAAFEHRTGKRFDLTVGDQANDPLDPQNAGDPEIAYCIMSYGMRTGMFTGKKLSDYINGRQADYVNARRIINGTDKAQLIAGYAESFETILKASESELRAVEVPDAIQHAEGAAFGANLKASEPSIDAPTSQPIADAANPPQQANEAGSVATQINVQPATAEPAPVVKSPFDGLTEIASTGMGKIGQKLTGATVSAGTGAMIWAFFQTHWQAILLGFVLAIFLIGVGIALFAFAYNWQQKKKAQEAAIRSNPQLFNVTFQK
jgi:putative chitinase